MKLALALMLGSTLAGQAASQTWSKYLDFPNVTQVSLDETADGRVAVAIANTANDTQLTWMDANGGLSLQRVLSSEVLTMDARADGSLLLAGSDIFDFGPAWVGAVDSSGALTWEWHASKDINTLYFGVLLDVHATADGGGVATGYRGLEDDYEEFITELVIYRFDAGGNLLWDRRLGDALTSSPKIWGYGVTELSDGTFMVVGGHHAQLLVMRLDAAGNLLWKQVLPIHSRYPRVVETTTGQVILCAGSSFEDDMYLASLTPGGAFNWQRQYAGKFGDLGRALVAMPDGGVVLAGRTASYGIGNASCQVIRVDASGELLWQSLIGDGSSEIGQDAALSASGQVLLGLFHQKPGLSGGLALRMDPDGSVAGCALPATYAQTTVLDLAWEPVSEPLEVLGEVPAGGAVTVVASAVAPVDLCATSSVGARYCDPAVTNSSGQAAELWVTETTFSAQFDLVATRLPKQQFGYFVTGMSSGSVTPPGSQGVLCLTGGPIYRFAADVTSSGVNGTFGITFNVNSIPGHGAIQPGETWNFQGWFRDKNPTTTSNFTDAVSVGF